MLLLILLAILAIVLFSVGFVVHWLFIIAAIVAIIWLISLFTGGFGAGARRWEAAGTFRMSRAAHCGPPVPVRPCGGVADRNPHVDSRLARTGDPAPEVDLVGVLGLPPLLRQAQGLLVRRDRPLDHVPLTRS